MAPLRRDGDVDLCVEYAAFASGLTFAQFNIAYWLLFLFVISMLFAASWRYGRSMEKAEKLQFASPEHRRVMKHCFIVCTLYSAFSVVAVVMEVYALLALQFCLEEQLMPLFWSTWTMIQVGSLIAILGILLAVHHNMCGRKHPPWALALGTPVLVIAGLGHYLQHALRSRVNKVRSSGASRSRRRSRAHSDSNNLPISRQDTLEVEQSSDGEPHGDHHAKLVGFTPEGGPILEFSQEPGVFDPARALVLAKDMATGHVIVAFHKGAAIINRITGRAEPSRNTIKVVDSPIDFEKAAAVDAVMMAKS